MSRSAVERRDELCNRSVFDYHELSKHFIETGLLSKSQAEKLVKGAALCTESPEKNVPWKEIAPELPHAAYKQLDELNFKRYTSTIIDHLTSERKDTCKLLIRLQDGLEVETCIMRFGLAESEEEEKLIFSSQSRATVCVSSQVGCKMGCTFCATGTMGLSANLTSGEILEQIMLANQIERQFRNSELIERVLVAPKDGRYVRNVVFMGMGEPLDNYNEVIRSIRCLTNAKIFALAPSRITLSTVGFSVARIRNLIDDVPRCSLALSLHAPTQKLRDEIVPTSKGVDLKSLLAACFAFVANQKKLSKTNAKRQCLLIEYCIIADKNDNEECARELGHLFQSMVDDVMVNIIPYNSTDVKANFEAPSTEQVDAFVSMVRSYGVRVFVRQEHGRDISGACGQLAVKKKVGSQMIGGSDGGLEDPSDLSDDEFLQTPKSSEKVASHFSSLADEEIQKKDTSTDQMMMKPQVERGACSRSVTHLDEALHPNTTQGDTHDHLPQASDKDPDGRLVIGRGDSDKGASSYNPLRRVWNYLSGPQDPELASEEDRVTAAKERTSRRLLIGGGLLLAGTLLVRHLLVSFDPPSSSARRRRR